MEYPLYLEAAATLMRTNSKTLKHLIIMLANIENQSFDLELLEK